MVNLNELSSSPQGTLGQIIHSFLSIESRFPLSIELAKCAQIYQPYHPLFINSFSKDNIKDKKFIFV